MKVTQEQLIEALQKLGVQDVEIVENADDSEYNLSELLTTVDTTRTPIIKQKVEGELTDSITAAKLGELNGMFKKMIAKTFGVSASQLYKLETTDEALEFAKKAYTEQFDGDKQETDRKFNELVERYNKEKEEVENEWKGKYTKLEDEHYTGKMIEHLHEQLKEVPTTWDKMVAAKEILNYSKSLYDVKIEDGKLNYYEKGTNRIALNKAGNEHLKHADIAREYLEPRNGWATDTRNLKPTEQQQNNNIKKEVNPYVDVTQTDKLADTWQAIEQARAAATE